ncbi:MAG: NAD(P)/FAD-dependent oxidoreductase [Gammaproteobacteria bacterium]|nr:NAD(P)/FAD-dependent oxidoreductase [Gammaproteobacteria bacterium]NNJ49242.1 NAD(P)/FAD-dependent oxidoreductase [Gammaproteobacteria bacterium]
MTELRDLVVIGGGAGGLVVASVAAQLGLDVVLINKEEAMGGDCLHYGCVPSKALLKSASVAHTVRHAGRWGIGSGAPQVDMQAVNQVIKNAIDTIQVHDSRERFEALGCEVLTGEARFSGHSLVEVGDTKLSAKHFVIATGSSAWLPPIKGLRGVQFLTNEDMFSLPTLPKSMIVLGGGPVGVEMAQAYSRLGTDVTIIELAPRLLPRMDQALSEILADVLLSEGVVLEFNQEVVEVSEGAGADGRTEKQVTLIDGTSHRAEALLVAIGRRPVVDSLNLDQAGIDFTAQGITVNRKMQTSNRKVFACGDVTGEMPLTHVAELQAGIVIANLIFKFPKKINYDVVPAVVYSEPEVAQVGISVEQCNALAKGEVYQFEVEQLDRAVTDNKKAGIAKILTDNGRIVGAHIIAPHAGELIHELALAVQNRMKVSKLTALVHAYPSYSQLNKRLAGQYYKDRLFSPFTKKMVAILNRIF